MKKSLRCIGMVVMACFLSLSFSFAQDKQMEINKIKKDRNYLTATGSSTVSEEDALKKAREQIDALIVQWLTENAKEDISGYVAKSKESLTVIDTKRGNLFRSFVYVKKQEILPYYKGDVMISDLPQEQPTEAETTALAPRLEDTPERKETTDHEPKVEDVSTTNPVVGDTKEMPKVVAGIRISKEEEAMLKIFSVSALGNYLKQLYQKGRLADFNEDSAWPQEGTVYLFVADYNEVIRERMKLEQGVAVDLREGKRMELKNILNKYESGTYFWMTLK